MIYFIGNIEKQIVKIGFSRNEYTFKSRINTLQTASPFKLEVLKKIEGDKRKEKELHNKFKHLCLNGEWFNHVNEIVDFYISVDDYKEEIDITNYSEQKEEYFEPNIIYKSDKQYHIELDNGKIFIDRESEKVYCDRDNREVSYFTVLKVEGTSFDYINKEIEEGEVIYIDEDKEIFSFKSQQL